MSAPRRGGTPLQRGRSASTPYRDRRQKLEQREEAKGRGVAHTEYWCVFDRDEHATFDEAVRLARQKNINLAVSNPCLELWFVWHFQDQTAYIERGDVQRLSRKLLGCAKALTPSALEMLAEPDGYGSAKQRALSADARHAGDGSPAGSNPSSGMHTLVERISRGARAHRA
jgi:hypothetical protein